jgi:hypothetical protein
MIERSMTAVAGEPLVGIEYRFPYPPRARASEYSRRLADRARFSAGRMELRVPKKILCLPSLTGDTQTHPAITFAAEPELAWQRSGGDLVGRIGRRFSEQRGSRGAEHYRH